MALKNNGIHLYVFTGTHTWTDFIPQICTASKGYNKLQTILNECPSFKVWIFVNAQSFCLRNLSLYDSMELAPYCLASVQQKYKKKYIIVYLLIYYSYFYYLNEINYWINSSSFLLWYVYILWNMLEVIWIISFGRSYSCT